MVDLVEKKRQELAQEILGVDYELEEMCVNCALNRLKDNRKHSIHCTPLKAGTIQTSKPTTEEEYFKRLREDPVFFSKELAGFNLRKFQQEILYCTSRRKVLRLPRRSGKSVAMVISAIMYSVTHKNRVTLIAAPYENQVRLLFDKMNDIITNSDLLYNSIIKETNSKSRIYSANPYRITFGNKSRIIGFTTGQKGAANIRGQDASVIILDEADYMSKQDIEAILAILATSPDSILIAASTPSGRRDYFYKWCKSDSFKEVHYKYQEMEHYDPAQDEEFKREYDKESYEREILAEFTLMESGVYRPDFINRAIEDYKFDDLFSVPEGIYTIGVDWNETASGVHMVVLRYEIDKNKIRVSNIIQIPPSNFTQLEAVEKILELNLIYKPKKILLDAGYGNTQYQMLLKKAEENPLLKLEERLQLIPFQSKIQLMDPISGQAISQQIKTHIVSISVRYLENNRLILPQNEDYPNKLVGIMRNYAIEGFSDNNEPRYTKGNVHVLEAWQLALYGMWLISKDNDPGIQKPVAYKPEYSENREHVSMSKHKRSRNALFSLSRGRGTFEGRRRWL